jgi:hypothetical protein
MYGFAEITESFLTWNEGKTKIVQCVTMGNSSHSETINKFHIKSEGWITNSSLLQSVLQYQEKAKRQHGTIEAVIIQSTQAAQKIQCCFKRHKERGAIKYILSIIVYYRSHVQLL